jgi:hypothetical protein
MALKTLKKKDKVTVVLSRRDRQYLNRVKRALRDQDVFEPSDEYGIREALALAYSKLGPVPSRARPKKTEVEGVDVLPTSPSSPS